MRYPTEQEQTSLDVLICPLWVASRRSELYHPNGSYYILPRFGGSSFNGRDMDGNCHFTSLAAVGATLGARDYAAPSPGNQYTSNRDLNSTNPGLNMIALNIFIDFSNRRVHRTGETP